MVGTLAVTLPSSYAGGELMVGHNGDSPLTVIELTRLNLVQNLP